MSKQLKNLLFLAVLCCGFMLGSFSESQAQKRYRVGYKDQGFSFILDGSVVVPSNTYPLAYNMNAIAGGQINANFFAGGGVGLDVYNSNLLVTPFADLRYFFFDNVLTPFLYLDAGYALPVDADEDLNGGLMLNPGVGLKYFVTRSAAFNIGLGYRSQDLPRTTVDATGATVTTTNLIHGLAFRMGFQF